jgi:Tfp pilus assembly protein PilO
MAGVGKKMGTKQELALSATLMVVGIGLWYFILYQPVAQKTSELQALVDSQQDSLEAVKKYKLNVTSTQIKITALQTEIATWDARFPERKEIVNLATQILDFSSRHNLELIDMRPSLYELYALERAGAHMSGKYVMQLPLSCHFRGLYLNLGKMLEDVSSLPFNVTVADVKLSPVPSEYPLLDIRLRVFLYVRL